MEFLFNIYRSYSKNIVSLDMLLGNVMFFCFNSYLTLYFFTYLIWNSYDQKKQTCFYQRAYWLDSWICQKRLFPSSTVICSDYGSWSATDVFCWSDSRSWSESARRDFQPLNDFYLDSDHDCDAFQIYAGHTLQNNRKF